MKIKGRTYDKEYIEQLEYILENGVVNEEARPKYEDGETSFSKGVFDYSIRIKEGTIPVLLSKRIYVKNAIREMLWIWQLRSNKVQDLEDMGCNFWREWQYEDGTIGECYGYQLAREVDDTGLNQVDNLIKSLKEDRYSRRHITTLWDISRGHNMILKPCVYETNWVVLGNKLNVKVIARSTDVTLGEVSNIFQYWVLQHLIANEVGLEVGELVFSMANPHIYDRHIEEVKNQIQYYKDNKDLIDSEEVEIDFDLSKGFYGFTAEDISMKDYTNKDIPKRFFERAI